MTCFITNCKSRSSHKFYEKEYISFHRMPSDETVKQKWYKIIPRAQRSWSKYSRICSKHFKKDCFLHEKDNNRRRLKTNAVPSLFLNDKLCDSVLTKSGHLAPLVFPQKQGPKTKSKSTFWNADADDSAKASKTNSIGQEQRDPSCNTEKESGYLQEGYYCNVCSNAISGYRYICVYCPDFDLCGGCEAQGEHALHYMLRVPEMRPQDEIMHVLETIREHLFKDENSVESSIVIESVKSEIKEESDLLGMDKSDINFSESWDKQLFNEEYSVQAPKTEDTEENEYITTITTPKRTRFESEMDLTNSKKYFHYVPRKNNTRSNYETTHAETLWKNSGVTNRVQEITNDTSSNRNVTNVVAETEDSTLQQKRVNIDESISAPVTFLSNPSTKDAEVTAVRPLIPENIARNCAEMETRQTKVASAADIFYSVQSRLTTATGMRESGNIKPLPQSHTPEKPCFLVLELSNSDTEKKIKINVKRISPEKKLPWDQTHLLQP